VAALMNWGRAPMTVSNFMGVCYPYAKQY